MIQIQFSLSALFCACAATVLVNVLIMRIWHARYDHQFGIGFILSGVVALFLPMLTLVGLPVYCVLAFGFPLWFQIPVLLLWGGGVAGGLWVLRRVMLRKIFKRRDALSSTSPEPETSKVS